MRKTAVLLLAFFVVGLSSFSLFASAFEDTGFSARVSGMGDSFTGLANDASAMLYNPAGAGLFKTINLTLSYASLFTGMLGKSTAVSGDTGISTIYFAGYVPIESGKLKGTVGAGIRNFSINNYRETALFLSGAKALDLKVFPLSVGVNLKLLMISLSGDYLALDPVMSLKSMSAFSADVGILAGLLRNPEYDLNLGICGFDLLSPSTGLKDTTANVPLRIRSGLAITLKTFIIPINIVADYILVPDQSSDNVLGGGVELFFFQKKLAFRAGGNNNAVTLGLGFRLAGLTFDYGYSYNYGELADALGSNRVSLNYIF